MITFRNENVDPAINLAMEEYILTRMGLKEDVLFFYVNQPSIIIGRNQNTLDEINQDYVQRHGIHVTRRLSGGGAVYHDFGNLNFSFIMPNNRNPAPDFRHFTAPIVEALNQLGAPVNLNGRNDLTLHECKVSGNAWFRNSFGAVSHGTLLFDTDLSILSSALKADPEKLADKGVKSVRSRVCNLKPALPEIRDVQQLKENLTRYILKSNSQNQERIFTSEDIQGYISIADNRYRSPLWNYGQSPAFNTRRRKRFPFGIIDMRLQIEANVIRKAMIFGDFFNAEDVSRITDRLNETAYSPDAISFALKGVNVAEIIPCFTETDLIAMIFGSN